MIIEDNKLLREGLKAMFKEHAEFQVIAALSDKINVLEKIRELKPDILLLDIGLVNHNSLRLVKSLKKKFPELKMIVMDLLPIQSDIKQFIEDGVTGFILKDATTEEFMDTIRRVAKGEKIFPSQLHGSLVSEIVDDAVNELMDSKLIESIRMTDNEKKIIDLISTGLTDEQISKNLTMEIPLVKSHIDNILEKMSLNTRVQIAVYKNSEEESVKLSGNKSKDLKK